MKKVSLLLAGIMAVSMIAGCGSKGEKTSSGSGTTLTVEVFDRGNAPEGGGTCDNNFLTNLINSEFEKETGIKVKFVPIPRSEEVSKINVLLASNTAPDIIFTYDRDRYMEYAKQGGLTDLGEYIDKYAPNIKEKWAEILPEAQYLGKQMAIPALAGNQAQNATFIRKDWLDKLNLPVPKTTEEFYETMKAFKEKDPGNVGADNIIPYGLWPVESTNIDNHFGAGSLLWSFAGAATEEERHTVEYPNIPGWKEGTRFLNKMFNEGLIDNEFAIDTARLKQDVSKGVVGCFTNSHNFPYSGNGNVMNALKQNVADAELIPIDVFNTEDGKYPKVKNTKTGMFIMVPKTSKNAEAAVKYLEWMAKNETRILIGNGVEGQDYDYIDDVYEVKDQDRYKKERWNSGDLLIMYNGGYFEGDWDIFYKRIRKAKTYGNYGDLMAEATKIALNDGVVDYRRTPKFDRPIEAMGKYKGTLDKIYIEGMVEAIMTSPDKFDSVYDAMVEEYMKNGGAEVEAEKAKVYAEMSKK